MKCPDCHRETCTVPAAQHALDAAMLSESLPRFTVATLCADRDRALVDCLRAQLASAPERLEMFASLRDIGEARAAEERKDLEADADGLAERLGAVRRELRAASARAHLAARAQWAAETALADERREHGETRRKWDAAEADAIEWAGVAQRHRDEVATARAAHAETRRLLDCGNSGDVCGADPHGRAACLKHVGAAKERAERALADASEESGIGRASNGGALALAVRELRRERDEAIAQIGLLIGNRRAAEKALTDEHDHVESVRRALSPEPYIPDGRSLIDVARDVRAARERAEHAIRLYGETQREIHRALGGGMSPANLVERVKVLMQDRDGYREERDAAVRRADALTRTVEAYNADLSRVEAERVAAAKRADGAEARLAMALGFRVGHVDIVPTFGGRWMLTKAGPRFEEQIAHIPTATLHERFPTAHAAFDALAAARRGTP